VRKAIAMRRLLLILCPLLSTSVLFAQQDIHFTQFDAAPLYINPATAGVFRGDIRLANNFRQQWSSIASPYQTINGSVDFTVAREVFESDFFGVGVSFYNDQAGDSKLSTNQGNLTVSYSKALDPMDYNYFSMGIQGGWAQRSVSTSGLDWGDEWDGMAFNNATTEKVLDASTSFIDVSSGIHWFFSPNESFRSSVGLALFHLNGPNVNFLGKEERLFRKLVLHASCEIGSPGATTFFVPKFFWSQQSVNKVMIAGADMKFMLKDASQVTKEFYEMSLSVGGYYRFGDALIAHTRFNWAGLSLGISYDINLSDLAIASKNNGGPELMLMWRTIFPSHKAGKKKTAVRFL